SSRRRHTRSKRDWSSDVCSSDLVLIDVAAVRPGVQDFGANTKPPHELRSNAARRAVRAVHHQSERREIEAGPDELRKVMGIELEIGRASCRERVEGWGGDARRGE